MIIAESQDQKITKSQKHKNRRAKKCTEEQKKKLQEAVKGLEEICGLLLSIKVPGVIEGRDPKARLHSIKNIWLIIEEVEKRLRQLFRDLKTPTNKYGLRFDLGRGEKLKKFSIHSPILIKSSKLKINPSINSGLMLSKAEAFKIIA